MQTDRGRFLSVVLLCLIVSGCDRFFGSAVRINNQSKSVITAVRVTFPGKMVNGDNIDPKGVENIYGSAGRDGVIVLEYVKEGRAYRHEISYVAPPFSIDCQVVVFEEAIERKCKAK